MAQEDRKLLLTDLFARLPYGVHCCVLNFNKTIKEDNDIIYGIVGGNIVTLKSDKDECYMYYQIKPYLRPMSSMTEEELHELQDVLGPGIEIRDNIIDILDSSIHIFSLLELHAVFDWLNKHHFDYRGLIEKGLALEAPEGMYNVKEK